MKNWVVTYTDKRDNLATVTISAKNAPAAVNMVRGLPNVRTVDNAKPA